MAAQLPPGQREVPEGIILSRRKKVAGIRGIRKCGLGETGQTASPVVLGGVVGPVQISVDFVSQQVVTVSHPQNRTATPDVLA